jgi:MoaA/NifB/PqqE/SkfB family radical SAM enzyme
MTIEQRANDIWGTDRTVHLIERPPLPKNMLVELSNGCNHACAFCANPLMKRDVGRIDGDLLDRVMAEAAANGCEEIGFYTTGEPLIHKQLDQFTAKARDLGFRYIYISTNGAWATPARMRALLDAGMNSIKFSINAGTRETYATIHGRDDWDKVMANLKALSDYRKEIGSSLVLSVSCVVTRQVEHEQDALRAAVGHLVDEIYFVQSGNQTGNMAAAQKLFVGEASHGRGDGGICPLPFMRLHVTVEGYLTLCCTDYQNYLAVEDLKGTSLMDAWHGPNFVEARRLHLERKLEGTLCGNCWLGRCDAIEPLRDDLADRIDFNAFYDEQVSVVEKRLGSAAED